MLTKRRRRFGVSSVIGAIFFILVVFLVFSATVLVFQSFTGYSQVVKQVNQQDAQNRATNAGISTLLFGGLLPQNSVPPTETLTATLNNLASTRSLLPISDMNFSNNMNGWVFSRDYKVVRDDGYVTNSFLDILPGETVFTLAVTNADPSGTCALGTSCITKVSIQVDSRFTVPACPGGVPSPGPCPFPLPAGWSVSTAGNTITWTTPQATGISSGAPEVDFTWTAFAPAVPGTYFQTVTLTWLTVFHLIPINDQGFVSVETDVVTGGPGGVSIPTLCPSPPSPPTTNICAEPAGVIPGGSVGGYDGVTGVGSESGPGSLYLDFQPTYNGATIVGGQELTALMNFTSVFSIDPGEGGSLASGAADAVNFGFSLDQVVAPPNPLILINVYLVQLTNTGATNAIIQIPNTTPVVPTQFNNFNSSGWITCGPSSISCAEPYFNPVALAAAQGQPAWVWNPGGMTTEYELVISVAASMPGASPPSINYPSSLLMHFDDIGLALQQTSSSYFVDNSVAGAGCVAICLLQIPFSTVPSQVQSIQLTTNIALNSLATQNVTAYVFVGDVSRSTGTPVWVEVGQLELSSSATLSVSIPSASASNYIDETGHTCGGASPGICVRVYAVSDGNKLAVNYNFVSLTASASAVVQTFQYNSVTLSIFNNSTVPIGFTNIYISGPDGVSSYELSPSCTASALVTPGSITPCYINQGQELTLPLTFVWKTDQSYVATVVTNKGLSFSESFVSP